MTALRNFNGPRFARLLTLVGLLCVAGLQLHEVEHWQEAGDTSGHCLVCKSTSAVAVDAGSAVPTVSFGSGSVATRILAPFPAAPYASFLPRGPPHHS